jgi:hypothetical protein
LILGHVLRQYPLLLRQTAEKGHNAGLRNFTSAVREVVAVHYGLRLGAPYGQQFVLQVPGHVRDKCALVCEVCVFLVHLTSSGSW